MDAKVMESLRGESLKRKHNESIQDKDEAIQTACKKVHLVDGDEDVDRETNTSVAEEDLKTAQPGLDEQNMEDVAGPSTRHETTQGEEDAARKTMSVEVNNTVMTFFFRLEGPKKTRKEKKSKVSVAPVFDDAFEQLHGKECDVEFLFKGTNYSIGSHVDILAEKSWIFDAMFKYNVIETQTGRVLNENIRPKVFKELLHYIYTDPLSTPLNEGVVQPLYIIAVKYRIEPLEKICLRYMSRIMKDHNVVKLFAFFLSHTYPDADAEKFMRKCERFIVRNRRRMTRYCRGRAWDKVVECCQSLQ